MDKIQNNNNISQPFDEQKAIILSFDKLSVQNLDEQPQLINTSNTISEMTENSMISNFQNQRQQQYTEDIQHQNQRKRSKLIQNEINFPSQFINLNQKQEDSQVESPKIEYSFKQQNYINKSNEPSSFQISQTNAKSIVQLKKDKQSLIDLQYNQSQPEFQYNQKRLTKCTQSPLKTCSPFTQHKQDKFFMQSANHSNSQYRKISEQHFNQQQKLSKQKQLQSVLRMNIGNEFVLFHIKVHNIIIHFCDILIQHSKSNYNLKRNRNQSHFNILRDKTEFQHSQSKSKIKRSTKIIFKLYNLIPVFMPSNIYFVVWNISILILTFLQFLFIPIKIAFQIKIKTINDVWMYTMPLFYSFINILICANMGFYKNGQTVTNKKKILQNYLKAEFWYDFIPTVALIITEEQDQNYLLVFAYLEMLRIFQLNTLMQKVEFHFNLYEKYTTPTRLLKLLFIIISVAHYTGCGFIYVGRNFNQENSWITDSGSETSYDQYLNSFYFSVITMSTVGYGDLNPVNNTEKIYVVFITIIACGVFAYAINTIGTIFQEQEQKSAKIRSERFELVVYLQQMQVKNQLQKKALNYLNYIHQVEIKQNIQKGKHILTKISKNIREEIIFENYIQLLIQQRFLKTHFSNRFLKSLCLQIHEQQYGPGDQIFEQGQINEKIYFLLEGQLEIQFYNEDLDQNSNFYNQKKNSQFVGPIIEQNTVFGLESLFTNQKQNYSIVSQSMARIAHFSKQQFMNSLLDFPNDYEVYQDLLDQYRNKLINVTQCFFCKNYQHSTEQCYLTQYLPDKLLLISRLNHQSVQFYNQINNYEIQSQLNNNKYERIVEKQNSWELSSIVNVTIKMYRLQLTLNPEQTFQLKNQQYQQDLFDQIQDLDDQAFFFHIPVYQNDQNMEINLYYQNDIKDESFDFEFQQDDKASNFQKQRTQKNKKNTFKTITTFNKENSFIQQVSPINKFFYNKVKTNNSVVSGNPMQASINNSNSYYNNKNKSQNQVSQSNYFFNKTISISPKNSDSGASISELKSEQEIQKFTFDRQHRQSIQSQNFGSCYKLNKNEEKYNTNNTILESSNNSSDNVSAKWQQMNQSFKNKKAQNQMDESTFKNSSHSLININNNTSNSNSNNINNYINQLQYQQQNSTRKKKNTKKAKIVRKQSIKIMNTNCKRKKSVFNIAPIQQIQIMQNSSEQKQSHISRQKTTEQNQQQQQSQQPVIQGGYDPQIIQKLKDQLQDSTLKEYLRFKPKYNVSRVIFSKQNKNIQMFLQKNTFHQTQLEPSKIRNTRKSVFSNQSQLKSTYYNPKSHKKQKTSKISQFRVQFGKNTQVLNDSNSKNQKVIINDEYSSKKDIEMNDSKDEQMYDIERQFEDQVLGLTQNNLFGKILSGKFCENIIQEQNLQSFYPNHYNQKSLFKASNFKVLENDTLQDSQILQEQSQSGNLDQ